MSDALVAFLTARLDEEEQGARTAEADHPSPWRWIDPGGKVKQALVDARLWTIVPSANADVYPSVKAASHIARHDPARVLREVAAKRRIVARHRPTRGYDGDRTDGLVCQVCAAEDHSGGLDGRAYPCDDLRDLASVWLGHPDYEPAWAVAG